jgi:hypothetical protein
LLANLEDKILFGSSSNSNRVKNNNMSSSNNNNDSSKEEKKEEEKEYYEFFADGSSFLDHNPFEEGFGAWLLERRRRSRFTSDAIESIASMLRALDERMKERERKN